ncbi:protein kinase [Streptomyces sp. NPDC086787]|uniref:protein kinase domain-containing protein n=1 Tax=Streptomyces sp. NPDC086787 TaxID=3365759 RepID=UPI00381EB386
MSEDGEHTPDGRLLGGRYRLTERIGSGSAGTVWRARDETGKRDVAVRELRPAGDPLSEDHRRGVHRLLHEARAASRVRHPAAVGIHEVLVEDGRPWTVMELVRGEQLRTVLERGPFAPAEAARVGLAVLGALRAAHAVGIVHRDVRPGNVLLESGTARVVLTGFGMGHGDHTGFAAPELLSGRGAGPASDLWSLGALLRAAMAPHEPTGPFGTLLARLLATEPEARPDGEEVARALEEIAGPQSTGPQSTGLQPTPEAARPAEAVRSAEAARPVEAVRPSDVIRRPSDAVRPPDVTHPPEAVQPAVAPAPHPRRPLLAALGLLLPKKPEAD